MKSIGIGIPAGGDRFARGRAVLKLPILGLPNVQSMGPTLQVPDVGFRLTWVERGSLARARAELYGQQPIRDPKLIEAAAALENEDASKATRIASKFLAKHPRSADALNIMAEVA